MDLELVYRKYRSERERLLALHQVSPRQVCPKCGSDQLRLFTEKSHPTRVTCKECSDCWSVLAYTFFERSQHSLGEWFELIKFYHRNPKAGRQKASKTLGVAPGWADFVKPKIMAWLYTVENELGKDKD